MMQCRAHTAPLAAAAGATPAAAEWPPILTGDPCVAVATTEPHPAEAVAVAETLHSPAAWALAAVVAKAASHPPTIEALAGAEAACHPPSAG